MGTPDRGEAAARSAGGAARSPAPTVSSAPEGFVQSPEPTAFHAGTGQAGESLNDRLKHLSIGGDVDYRPKRVAIGDAQAVLDNAVSAYEDRLAPPTDILRLTFGFIYERRTTTRPDSLAYVYDSYSIGPIRMCKAWKITEHPYVAVAEVGSVARNAGIGGGVVTNANSPVVRHDAAGSAEVTTVQFPCTEKSYTAVPRGSLTTPLPRHPDLSPRPAPAEMGTPMPPSIQPSRSLAP